jgi:hypothetical protein
MPGLNNAGVNLPSVYHGFRISVWQDQCRKRSACLYLASPRPLPEGEGE